MIFRSLLKKKKTQNTRPFPKVVRDPERKEV